MQSRTLLLVFLLAELVSLTAHFFPVLNTVGFFVIIGAALALALRQLEYGLYFVLADLMLGGKAGALFSFEHGGFFLSLRMALFIVVMGVWVGKVISKCRMKNGEWKKFWRVPFLKWWGLLGVAVVWGIIVGLARGNDFGNLFLDVNGYFYGALILPFVWAFGHRHSERSEESHTILMARGEILRFAQDDMVWRVFFAATTILALKTLFAVYLFTHAGNNFITANLVPFYHWVRDSGVGEITWLPGNFARVFFQSHIYNIAAFFVLLVGYIERPILRRAGGSASAHRLMLLTLNAVVIIVSLSRSFWVGAIMGLITLGVFAGQAGHLRRMGGALLIALSGATLLLLLVARFPLPRPAPIDWSAAAESRIAFEPAAASRWNLLPVMWTAIREHPILGSGFGHTVTYISNDPRIREVNPSGQYTTYALEWGWLDIWLKLGLIGLIGIVGLIGKLSYTLWRYASNNRAALVALAVLIVLATIHFFTPYLNHPLGLGILILISGMLVLPDKQGYGKLKVS